MSYYLDVSCRTDSTEDFAASELGSSYVGFLGFSDSACTTSVGSAWFKADGTCVTLDVSASSASSGRATVVGDGSIQFTLYSSAGCSGVGTEETVSSTGCGDGTDSPYGYIVVVTDNAIALFLSVWLLALL